MGVVNAFPVAEEAEVTGEDAAEVGVVCEEILVTDMNRLMNGMVESKLLLEKMPWALINT